MSGGWTPDDTWSEISEQDEVAIVMLGGRCRVTSGNDSWEIGERTTIFDGQPWALYLPIGTAFTVEALTVRRGCDLLQPAPRVRHEPVLIRPEDVAVEIRGAGNAARQINHIIPPDFPAHRLLVVEVFTPNGNWSSLPAS